MVVAAIIGVAVYLALEHDIAPIKKGDLPTFGNYQIKPLHAGMAAAALYFGVTEYVLKPSGSKKQFSTVDGDLGFYDYDTNY